MYLKVLLRLNCFKSKSLEKYFCLCLYQHKVATTSAIKPNGGKGWSLTPSMPTAFKNCNKGHIIWLVVFFSVSGPRETQRLKNTKRFKQLILV